MPLCVPSTTSSRGSASIAASAAGPVGSAPSPITGNGASREPSACHTYTALVIVGHTTSVPPSPSMSPKLGPAPGGSSGASNATGQPGSTSP